MITRSPSAISRAVDHILSSYLAALCEMSRGCRRCKKVVEVRLQTGIILDLIKVFSVVAEELSYLWRYKSLFEVLAERLG